MNTLKTFGEMIYDSLKEKKFYQTALINVETGEETKYGELLNLSVKLSNAFLGLGLQKSDTILVHSENSWKQLLTGIACFYIGAPYMILDTDSKKKEARYFVSVVQPHIIACSSQNLADYLDFQKEFDCIKHIFTFGDNPASNISTFDKLLQNADTNTNINKNISDDDVIALHATSGTTGTPKCVEITQKNFKHRHSFPLQKDKSMVVIISQFECNRSFSKALLCLFSGILTIYQTGWDDIELLTAISLYKVTHVHQSPEFFKALINSSMDFSSIRNIIIGGSLLRADLLKQIRKRVRQAEIYQVYGMTECKVSLTKTTPNMPKTKENSVGAKFDPKSEIRVIDVKTGVSLGPNEIGEIQIKSDGVMKGYRNDAKATAAAFQNGFLRSGDLGYYDKDNYFYLIDRIKNIINFQSISVPPLEIESILLEHQDVQNVAVIAIAHESFGEVAKAFVVKKDGALLTEENLLGWYNNLVSTPKQLHGGVVFVKELPKNSRNKILRQKLK